MFGFCLGGMVSVMINAIRDDFKRTIMMTVGGEMATLMWHSPTLEYFRKSVEKMKGTGRIKYSVDDNEKDEGDIQRTTWTDKKISECRRDAKE